MENHWLLQQSQSTVRKRFEKASKISRDFHQNIGGGNWRLRGPRFLHLAFLGCWVSPSHCSTAGRGEMLPRGFKRKENCAMLLWGAGVCVCVCMGVQGGPTQVTINSNDKVMAKSSLIDFDEKMKALNKSWGKTPRHRDFIKIKCLFWCFIKYNKSYTCCISCILFLIALRQISSSQNSVFIIVIKQWSFIKNMLYPR